MLPDRIIGRVAATILAGRLADARQSDGSLPDSAALFRLDKLASSQIAAIVREILGNPQLSSQVDLQIPSILAHWERGYNKRHLAHRYTNFCHGARI
jgi:S-DNA-T family DNA segregation ATPase FtsK/SpoIIIE